MKSTKKLKHIFAFFAVLGLSNAGCVVAADDIDDVEVAETIQGLTATTGFHGRSYVPYGAVVDENLAKQIPDNPNGTFWYFCGQAASATAINFARGTAPTTSSKITQLQWFHDRLEARQGSSYSINDPAGPYAAKISWLSSLLQDEKSTEFATTTLTSGDRETIKYNMTQALDAGAYVVALNQTDSAIGHYLTVYAIDYQPSKAGGGTVYYGDVLYGNLGSVNFTLFLDRMKAQSSLGLYNAFSVKRK